MEMLLTGYIRYARWQRGEAVKRRRKETIVHNEYFKENLIKNSV